MTLRVDRDERVAVVTLDRGSVNALDIELCEALIDACAALAADEAVGAVVLTGAGRAFSAGVDLKRIVSGGADYTRRFVQRLSACFLAVYALPKPTVAAINGHAIAGGCVLACACDRVLAADGSARMGLTELDVGVPFPSSALEIMRARLGPRLAPVVWDAGLHPLSDARAVGLVDDLVDESALLDTASGLAARLASRPRQVAALTKRQLRAPVLAAIEAGAAAADAEVADSWCSDAAAARIRAFLDATVSRR